MIHCPSLARIRTNPQISIASWYAVLLAALVAAIAMLGTVEVKAAPEANPAEAFVQHNIEKGYTILNSTTLGEEQRRAQFRDFMLSLTDARRIYERAGFTLSSEDKHHSFGHDLVGQIWETDLV